MKRKLISALLAVCMVLTLFPTPARAAENEEDAIAAVLAQAEVIKAEAEEVQWSDQITEFKEYPWKDGAKYGLLGSYGPSADGMRFAFSLSGTWGGFQQTPITSFIVPASVNGKTVTDIADFGYRRWDTGVSIGDLTVTFSEGIRYIHRDALHGYSSELKSICLPASLTYLGPAAFQHCRELLSVDFRNESSQLRYIGNNAFCNCVSLRTAYCTTVHSTVVREWYHPDSCNNVCK